MTARDVSFSPTEITLSKDKVNLTLVNEGAVLHDLTIPALGVRVVAAAAQTTTAGLQGLRVPNVSGDVRPLASWGRGVGSALVRAHRGGAIALTDVDAMRIQFVCVRALHHRHQTRAEGLCEVGGFAAYCPAGDVGGHDWMPAPTDLIGLARIGFLGPRDEADVASEDASAPRDEDMPELIRT